VFSQRSPWIAIATLLVESFQQLGFELELLGANKRPQSTRVLDELEQTFDGLNT